MKKKIFIIVASLVGVLVILFVIGLFATRGITKVVQNQLQAIRQGKIEQAYYAYTASQFQQETTLAEFKGLISGQPALLKNKKASFSERKVEGSQGFLKGTLTAEDGTSLPVEYRLVKENDEWKILSLNIPSGGIIKNNLQADNSQTDTNLSNVFSEPGYGYSIGYPADWIYQKQDEYTVIFSGEQGTDAYYSTVAIQNIASARIGGKFGSVAEVVADAQNQLRQADNASIAEAEEIEFTAEGGQKVKGKIFLASYTVNGEQYKQLEIVVPRADGKIFYTFAYTSPADQYDDYYPQAEAMFASWQFIGENTEDSTASNDSSLPFQLAVIDKPQVIDDFMGAYALTLRIDNKGSSTLTNQNFPTGLSGWNKDNIYKASVSCRQPGASEWLGWSTTDRGAKCPATGGYDVAKIDPFSAIPPGQSGEVTIHFCGSAFSELIMRGGELKARKEPPTTLECMASLRYGAETVGQSAPFSLNFAFDI